MKQCRNCGLQYDARNSCPGCGSTDFIQLQDDDKTMPISPQGTAAPDSPYAAPDANSQNGNKKNPLIWLIPLLSVLLVTAVAAVVIVKFYPGKNGTGGDTAAAEAAAEKGSQNIDYPDQDRDLAEDSTTAAATAAVSATAGTTAPATTAVSTAAATTAVSTTASTTAAPTTAAPTTAAPAPTTPTTPIKLESGVTYTGYDVTGDGAADEIRAECRTYMQTGDTGEAVVYVNGKEIQTFSGGASVSVTLAATDSNNVYIIPYFSIKGGSADAYIYRYKNGAFIKCTDENIIRLSQGNIKEAGPGYITVEMNTGKYEQWLLTRDTPLIFKSVYSVSGDKATRRSDIVPAGGDYRFTANKSFTASSTYAENDGAGCSVSEGDAVQITRCYIGNADACFEIECNGRTGWVSRSLSGNYSDPLLR